MSNTSSLYAALRMTRNRYKNDGTHILSALYDSTTSDEPFMGAKNALDEVARKRYDVDVRELEDANRRDDVEAVIAEALTTQQRQEQATEIAR